MAQTTAAEDTETYAVINNIPSSYHSADLRKFFSQFVESEDFQCFHFRHRPEHQSVRKSDGVSSDSEHSKETKPTDITTYCCIIKVKETRFLELIRTYHQRHWQDHNGDSMQNRCLISRLKTSSSSTQPSPSLNPRTESSTAAYITRGERKSIPSNREVFRAEDLLNLPELRPPSIMPNGNVGTPTAHFLRLINECRLPASIIKKLQLDFPKSKTKGKYGSVPFDYQTKGSAFINSDSCSSESQSLSGESRKDHKASSATHTKLNIDSTTEINFHLAGEKETQRVEEPTYKKLRREKKLERKATKRLMAENIEEKMIDAEKGGSDSGDDNDTCEEWERHEAMYDDVTNQERNKERLYEEEMEIVWEKGGSGLVFYTDAQYWEEKEGDFDEQTADDLDVDMSIYYEKGSGDKDIRDFVDIRREQRRRRGAEETDRFTIGIGKFEQYTKGFGRKIMEKQGWKDGCGLGSSVQGMADALENDGQNPRNKKGLGYHGEKLVRYAPKRRRDERKVLISTMYDSPSQADSPETLLRRNDLNYTKRKGRIN